MRAAKTARESRSRGRQTATATTESTPERRGSTAASDRLVGSSSCSLAPLLRLVSRTCRHKHRQITPSSAQLTYILYCPFGPTLSVNGNPRCNLRNEKVPPTCIRTPGNERLASIQHASHLLPIQSSSPIAIECSVQRKSSLVTATQAQSAGLPALQPALPDPIAARIKAKGRAKIIDLWPSYRSVRLDLYASVTEIHDDRWREGSASPSVVGYDECDRQPNVTLRHAQSALPSFAASGTGRADYSLPMEQCYRRRDAWMQTRNRAVPPRLQSRRVASQSIASAPSQSRRLLVHRRIVSRRTSRGIDYQAL
ncbi:hypothetical protein PHSY_001204 [Pseudozyma hubeiensis SY62]|uniref:Uncharacterized protein n=1 Tax=Pseudozyma hubeiensis (strain SY62) TaxID=1305764 RepID=R9NY83_PSEHS|nr:hypothetical protein PHSY_001204 [Pseudozyma hubeiensis SY62]GAC93639.1 hypothetical protein PHSY_001204 [Pseudozyma hubeiensis SY62]